MVPLAGIPNIEWILRHLKNQGITEFAINLHYCPKPLQTYLGDGSRFSVHIEYFHEPEILGTAGGIKNMIPAMDDETFIVVNGDVLFMPHLPSLINCHKKSGALASMVVRPADNAEALGAVGLNHTGQVRRLVWAGDQNIDELYMFTGMHIIEPSLRQQLPDKGCIVRSTYIPMVEQNGPIAGIIEDSAFRDLGTKGDYLDANLQIASGNIALPGFTPRPDDNIIHETVMQANGATVENSVIGENVIIESNIHVRQSIVMAGAVIKEDICRKIILSDGTVMNGAE